MQNKDRINDRKSITFNIPYIDFSSVWINCLILGILFTVLNGLKILPILRIFKNPELLPGKKSDTLMSTTKKSSIFQGSLK
jgi:hypothetical protein